MPPHSHVLSLVVLTNPWMQVVDGLEVMEELRIQVHQEEGSRHQGGRVEILKHPGL